MADLNKFQRSKERIAQILDYLTASGNADQHTNPYINTLRQSIQLIDTKIAELKNRELPKLK
ncbi:MAG TPA: hypothetical protein VHA56_15815 [Mucilaginibacter sp.]|nr:hypothetical protein [Mucilaginibacter sp.]